MNHLSETTFSLNTSPTGQWWRDDNFDKEYFFIVQSLLFSAQTPENKSVVLQRFEAASATSPRFQGMPKSHTADYWVSISTGVAKWFLIFLSQHLSHTKCTHFTKKPNTMCIWLRPCIHCVCYVWRKRVVSLYGFCCVISWNDFNVDTLSESDTCRP